jgi:hypothetical protein
MFDEIRDKWNNYGFEIILIFSIVFLILYWLSRYGKKGTYFLYNIQTENNKKRQVAHNQNKIPSHSSNKGDSKGEIICRDVLERVFNRPFDKIRPDYLNNEVTGMNLELDCYNSELRIACEYSGRQHYEHVPFFHKNKEAFRNQQYRDYMKKRMCQDLGIFLIEVPYTVKHHEIEGYIIGKLKSK